jgi:hypothetical protein
MIHGEEAGKAANTGQNNREAREAAAVCADGAKRNIRRFILHRMIDLSGVSGIGHVAEGVVFTGGKAVMRWTTEMTSTALFESMDDLLAIHGHNGSTQVIWLDDP